MKIELKLTADQIYATAKLLEQIYNLSPVDAPQKLMYSIALDLADMFARKQLDLHKKQSLFITKKPHKITLKFHEAYALQHYVESLLYTINDLYCSTILKKIAATLNQKLA